MIRFIEKLYNYFRPFSYSGRKRRDTTTDYPSLSEGATLPSEKIQDVIDVFHDISEHTEIHYDFLHHDSTYD